jgi:RHS repeat-associated protein
VNRAQALAVVIATLCAIARPTSATGIDTTAAGEQRYTLGLAYDVIGNITKNSQSAVTVAPGGTTTPNLALSHDWSYAYDPSRAHAASQIGARSIEYDANGNQLTWSEGSATRTLHWDEENRLTEVDDGEGTSVTSFLYDADGTRTHRVHGSDVTVYPSQFYTVRNGAITTEHVFVGETRIVSVVAAPSVPTQTYYYLSDHLQSTEYVTDASGAVVEHEESFPFGESWISELTTSERVPYLFTGKELDQDTGLYYFGARYYDPRTALWVSPDPILGRYLSNEGAFVPINFALYSYSWNSPVQLRDPDGNCPTPGAAGCEVKNAHVASYGTNPTLASAVAVGHAGDFARATAADTVNNLIGGREAGGPDERGYVSQGGNPTALGTLGRTTAGALVVVPLARAGASLVRSGVGRATPPAPEVTYGPPPPGTARTAAGVAADAAQATRPRPTTAAGMASPSGDVVTGTSGTGQPLAPGVQASYDAVPLELRSPFHGSCAEGQCLSQFERAGIDASGGTSAASRVRAPGNPNHNTPIAPCSSCSYVLDQRGISHE